MRHRSIDADAERWLKAQRNRLLGLGLPLSVLDSALHWQRFLEEGTFSSVSTSTPDVDVDAMPADQADRVLEFLVRHYPKRWDDGISPFRAINRLEAILKRGPHAA